MTCQLCGKPLPKMWLRRDGDFCCREHREQYRLRRGLNLLQEADELATLRRRRERPTPMVLQRPAGSAWEAPRRVGGCPYPGSAHHAEDRVERPLAIVSEMRLRQAGRIPALPRSHVGVASCARRGASPSRGIAPRLVLMPHQAAPRTVATEARVPGAMGFQARRASLPNAVAERRSLNCQAPLPRAPLVPRHGMAPASTRIETAHGMRAPAQAIPAPAPTRRGAEAPFNASGAPALPAHNPAALAVHPPAARFNPAGVPAARSRADRHAPSELAPRDIRASVRFGEMAARLARPRAGCRLGEAGGLKRSAAREKRATPQRGFAAMPFPAAEPAPPCAGTRFPLRATAMRLAAQLRAVAPPAPAPPPGQRISYPGGWTPQAIAPPAARAPRSRTRASTAAVAPMHMAPRTALDAMRPRATAVQCSLETAPPVSPARHAAPLAGPGQLATAHRRTTLASARGGLARQTALVPVPRHEPLLNRNPLTLQGTFMGTMEDAGTRVRLEENFAAGLSRWVGQVETWRLDAAGVRAGGLALFGPSLGMRDCEMEFLAKVESGGAGWVFRAADLNNYYLVRLRLSGNAAAPAWELVRGAVLNGVAEPPITAPLELALRAKASFRVQMAVAGGTFTVGVEGQEVARWSDSRLRAGGIGFLAEKDDRARLYWVKVASPAFGVDDE